MKNKESSLEFIYLSDTNFFETCYKTGAFHYTFGLFKEAIFKQLSCWAATLDQKSTEQRLNKILNDLYGFFQTIFISQNMPNKFYDTIYAEEDLIISYGIFFLEIYENTTSVEPEYIFIMRDVIKAAKEKRNTFIEHS